MIEISKTYIEFINKDQKEQDNPVDFVIERIKSQNTNVIGVKVISNSDELIPLVESQLPEWFSFEKNKVVVITTSEKAFQRNIELINLVINGINTESLDEVESVKYRTSLKRFFTKEYLYLSFGQSADYLNTTRDKVYYSCRQVQNDIDVRAKRYYQIILDIIKKLEKNGLHTPQELQKKVHSKSTKSMDKKT